MKNIKWLNLLVTFLLLVVVFTGYNLIMEFLIWLFEGLKWIVFNEYKWWTMLLFIVLLIVAYRVAIVQNFVETVIERVSGWFKKKDNLDG